MLDVSKEALDVPSLPICDAIVAVLVFAVTAWRDDGFAALVEDDVVQAGAVSFCWPGPSANRIGKPGASTTAWSLVPKPPRERPRAWA